MMKFNLKISHSVIISNILVNMTTVSQNKSNTYVPISAPLKNFNANETLIKMLLLLAKNWEQNNIEKKVRNIRLICWNKMNVPILSWRKMKNSSHVYCTFL